MPEPHAALNALDPAQAATALRRACGAERWVQRMLAHRPFPSTEDLYATAEREWRASAPEDYLEAFSHHPELGEDLEALRRRFQGTAGLSSREQEGVLGADDATLRALRDANAAYRQRFGFIFILCATGKTAQQVLEALRARLGNDRDAEIAIAAREQAEITRLRLGQLGALEVET